MTAAVACSIKLILAVLAVASVVGPTAAWADFCGVAGGSPQEIIANVARTKSFKRIGGDARYVAYADEAAMVTLTVTTRANKAHPAAACRRIVQKNGEWRVATTAKCAASQSACKAMLGEFRVLDAQMRQALEKAQSKP